MALESITATQLLLVASAFLHDLIKGTLHTFRSVTYTVFFLLGIIGTVQKDMFGEAAVGNAVSQAQT